MTVGKYTGGLPTLDLINRSLIESRHNKEHNPVPIWRRAYLRQQSFTSSWGRPCVRHRCLPRQGCCMDISSEDSQTSVTVHHSPIYRQKIRILPPPFSGVFEITLLLHSWSPNICHPLSYNRERLDRLSKIFAPISVYVPWMTAKENLSPVMSLHKATQISVLWRGLLCSLERLLCLKQQWMQFWN